MSDTDVLKMKVADLKRELKLRNLSTTGNKTELQERLQTSLLDGDLTLDDTAISEDLLDDGLTDDEEDSKLQIDLLQEEEALKAPKTLEKHDMESIVSSVPHKKVILKRNISQISSPSASIDPTSFSVAAVAAEPVEKILKLDEKIPSVGGEKKVIKISDLSIKERLENRAKKFGSPVSTDAAKLARAERFGIKEIFSTESNENNKKGISISTPATMEVLKKRAERFGGSVSSQMSNIATQEKLLKRQERFGLSTANNTKTSATPAADSKSTVENADKAQQRLERFKTAIK